MDSSLFYPIAFYGVLTQQSLLALMTFNFLFKVSVEIVFTPLTYLIVGWLKREEGIDTYDTGTRFTPFSLRDEGETRKYAKAVE